MAESLVIAGQIELLQGGVVSAIPACAGAKFLLAPGYDFGAPSRGYDVTAAVYLDGERPVGRRASNREISLPVKITAPDRTTLAAAREVLLFAIDHDPWHLTWSRDGTLPVVYDCFHAEAVQMTSELTEEQQLQYRFVVSFQALPYARSETPSVVDFQQPLAGKTAPPAPVTIDDFSTVSGTHWSQSALGPGPFSAFYNIAGSGVGSGPAVYTKTGLSLNLTSLPSLTVSVGLGSTSFYQNWGLKKAGQMQFRFTLTDGTRTISFHKTQKVKVTNNTQAPHWQKIRVPIPQGVAGFLYNAVTGYTVTVLNHGSGDLRYADLYLDTIEAVPVTRPQPVQPVTGAVYDLAGVLGTARSLMSLQVTQPAGVFVQATKQFTTSGAQSWLCPPGVPGWAYVQAVAAGGKGGISTGAANYAAGGGGGENCGDSVPVTPGTGYAVSVPSGGAGNSGRASSATFTHNAGTMTAQGGGNVADGSITGGVAGGPAYTIREQLSGDTATFEGGIANWTGAGNCSVAQTGVQFHGGTKSLAVTATATANMTAASCLAANVATQGEPCMAGIPVVVNHFTRAATTGCPSYAGAEFYDISLTSLGQLFGSSATDSTVNFTTNPTATITPPAGSVWLRRLVKWDSPVAGTVHYTDDWSLKVGYSKAGGVGGAGNNTPTGGGAGGGGAGGTTGAGSNGTAGSGSGAGGAAGAGAPPGASGGLGGRSPAYPKKGNQAGGGGGGWEGGLFIPPGGFPLVKGGAGQVNLTFLQSPTFKSLVAHRPGPGGDDVLTPFVSVDTTDLPDGATEYAVDTQIPGTPARFGSTYTIYLADFSWHSPSVSRDLSVTVKMYEQAGGTSYSQTTIVRSVIPNNLASKLVNLGELTIPDHAVNSDNTQAFFTVTVLSSDTADRFQDVLFLDTQGSTVIVESPVGYTSYWIDEPAVDREIGFIGGSQFDRGDAVSVMAYAKVSGPPLHVDPLGSAQLFLYAADAAAPSAQMTYFPRWQLDRYA